MLRLARDTLPFIFIFVVSLDAQAGQALRLLTQNPQISKCCFLGVVVVQYRIGVTYAKVSPMEWVVLGVSQFTASFGWWWLVADVCIFDAFAKISLEAMANRSPVFLVIGGAVVAAVVDLAVAGVFHGYVLSLMLLVD